jgi:predicted RecB family nuclease
MRPLHVTSTARQLSITLCCRRVYWKAAHLRNHDPARSPLSFTPWDKPDASDNLLVCFGALALSQVTGNLPDVGTLIYGEDHHRKTVKIGDHIAQTQQAINAIDATCYGPEPPTLVLNRHCAVCDFQAKCRSLAIERDDLSLLSAITAKERAKSNAKGFFTITQLSYGYRPRSGTCRQQRPMPCGLPRTASASCCGCGARTLDDPAL